jgi:cellulose synthase/poly-beta-1,6-N-acetylglucosamine synthase-like glycosyltransferase
MNEKNKKLFFVSIIIPAYNAAGTVEDCLHALVAQEYPEEKYEIIIVDNNSSDNTADIIRKFPIVYLLEEKIQSSYAARNRGIEKAKGDILAFTDSDCIPGPRWLEEGVKNFVESSMGAVAGKIVGAEPKTRVEKFLTYSGYLGEKACLEHPFLPYIQTANAFYRREVFEAIGKFNQSMISGGDADFAWRMQLQTNFKIKHTLESVVVHKHRSTIKQFFRQMYVHGIGKVDLEKIYLQEMQKKHLPIEFNQSSSMTYFRIFASFFLHFTKSLFFLLSFQSDRSAFEFINWLGKTGKRFGVLTRKNKLNVQRLS